MTVERSVQILNKNGLHARPAAEIVKAAARFKSDLTITRDDIEVNGKSIMGVMMLAAEQGSRIDVTATGPQAREAVEAIRTLVAARFQEAD